MDLFCFIKSDILTSNLFNILESFYLISDKFELLQMPYTLLLKVIAALLVVLTAPYKLQIIGKELGTSLVPAKLLGDDFPMVARFKIAPVPVVGLTLSVDGTLDVVLTVSSPQVRDYVFDKCVHCMHGRGIRELTRSPPQKFFSALALMSSLATL